MTLEDDRAGHRRRKPDPDARESEREAGPAPAPRRRRGGANEVGEALRTVYQRAVDEDIPPEMLDLLGKLG